ncbi:MAG: hypothetical protein N2662_02580 [Bacteroidales bacterium]|nr:hypothetical protein [Bacteroidales bacterium]
MRKILLATLFGFYAFTLWGGQTVTFDLSNVNQNFKKEFAIRAINVAACTSKIASPALSITNPFKGLAFDSIEISFEVYNYDAPKVLGTLISVFDASLGRMYFTNGSYLGYNATGGWFDANLKNYALDHDYLGRNSWKNVKLRFSRSGYSVWVNDSLAFKQGSTHVTINGNLTDYNEMMSFFANASIVAIGTGSWWSDNQDANGNYYDIQYSYIKNIRFTKNDSLVKQLDILQIDTALTTVIEGPFTVLDVATLTSKRDVPALAISNPFKGRSIDTADINFDVYNYGDLKVLGTLFSVYTVGNNGRLYFSNGSYLGYNATGGWFDANLKNYGIDHDFLGRNKWRNVHIRFTAQGYAVFVDGILAYDNTSTNVTLAGTLTDYNNVLSFLSTADTLAFGTGSWWSDNQDPEGNYYDIQYSYLKNISFSYTEKSDTIIDALPSVTAKAEGAIKKVEYYSMTGVRVQGDFSTFRPGVYIKVTYYKNGAITTTKVVKRTSYSW